MATATLPTVALKPPSGFVHDKTANGWTLVEDVEFTGAETLELGEFLEGEEQSVVGTTMLERSKKNPHASQRHLERLLGQQADIPKEWRRFYLVAPGTVWRYGDDLIVPYLIWHDDLEKWILYFYRLDLDFGSSVRLVRPCK